MMFATSCENELDLGTNAGENAQVTFSVGTPEIATRAYSDGKTATQLEYAVYAVGENNALTKLDLDGEKTFSISTTVELQLTTGNKYAVIFWAAAEDAPYDVDFAAKTMTVDYTSAVSNDEKRDAFYAYHEFTVSGAQTETIYLKRPFAQLNIGTSDYAATASAGYEPAYSYVKVPVCKVLNLVDGSVDTAADVEFALAAIPQGETFPVNGYDYLSMNYLLVSADKEVVDLTFGYSENDETVEKTRTVGSVPVQRNYRTNIYGQLFTSDVDINVEIVPGYDEEDLPNTFEEKLNIAAQLGGTVTLTEDVTLNEPLVVSGVQTRAANAAVALEIDLNGHALTYTSDAAAHSAMITVNSGNKLVVKDSKGTGKISYNYTGAGDSNFGWGTYTIANYGGTLVVENGTVEMVCDLNASSVAHMYCAVYQYSGSTTINGGKISTPTYRSARLWKGDMTINDGVFEGQVWVQAVDNTSVLTINGGSFAPRGVDGSSVFVTNDSKDVTLKVTGGTFETKIGCSDYTKDGVKGSVSGGVFGVAPDKNLLANGYIAVKNTEDKYTLLCADAANKTITINSADDFLYLTQLNEDWVALFSNGQGSEFLNFDTAQGGMGTAFYYKWQWTIKLNVDVDLNNTTLNAPINIDGWGTFDGQNHTIKNVNIITATDVATAAGLFTASSCAIKNLVVDNVTVQGSFVGNSTAGILASDCNGAVVDNITITHSSVTGGKYTGGVVGYGYTDVTNCTLTNCVVKGGYKLGGVIGYICAENNIQRKVDGHTLTNCTVNGADGQYAGGKDKYIVGKIVGNYNANGTCENNTIVNMTTAAKADIGELESGNVVNGANVYATTSEDLTTALASGSNVIMQNDLNDVAVQSKNDYGTYYGVAHNGGVFDGNGKTLDFNVGEVHNGKTDNWGIMTSGGTIKNVTITGVFRGIMIMNPTEDLYIDNVTIGDDDVCYAINTAEGDGTKSLYVSNSTIKGWSSYGTAIKDLTFTNCTFAQGSYYTNVFGRLVKPYVNTVFDGCEFNSKFYIDLSQLGMDGDGHVLDANAKIVLKNCTVNGVKLTAENWKTLIASESACGDGQISVELKDGSYLTADNVVDYVVFK